MEGTERGLGGPSQINQSRERRRLKIDQKELLRLFPNIAKAGVKEED
jgi:hypothetical protein